MTTTTHPTKIDTPSLLSLLWIYLLMNFLYCDVVGLHDGELLTTLLDGRAGTIAITPTFLLLASALMTVPISMILVSRLAPRTGNRIANIAAGLFMIVVQVSSLFSGAAPSPSYVFFSAIEIAGLAVIVVLAIRWKKTLSA